MQLQQMAGKLGIVTKMDPYFHEQQLIMLPSGFAIVLWVILELALMATDLAEVLGSAIALNLLFKIPIYDCYPSNRFRCIFVTFY